MTPWSTAAASLSLALALTAGCGDDTIGASDTASGASTTDAATTSGTTAETTTEDTTTTSTTTTGDSDSASTSSTATTGDSSTTGASSTTAVDPTTTTAGETTTTATTGDPECRGPDEDRDGVPDECDLCPGSDDLVDGDGDGVPDGCDLCADGDDALDGDGDLVPDACDPCPDDNPDDSDDDGVCDSDDVCAEGDDNVDVDDDMIPDACDDDVSAEIQGPLYDFDAAASGALVLSRFAGGEVFVTCYNPDLSVRKAEFVVGSYDLEPAPSPGPTVNIARDSERVLVAWHDPSGENVDPRMKYAYLDASCDVVTPETVAIEGVTYMEYHASAVDAAGNAAIAVSRNDTRITFIDSDGAIKSQQIAFDLAGTTYGTHVAMNQATGAGIVSAQPHSGSTLYYRRFDADGSWQDPGPVAVTINNHYWYDGHTVGMNNQGQFLLLWRSSPTALDFRVFDSDASVLADVQRTTPSFEGGSPFDALRRRHSEIPLRGDNFVLGEFYRSKAPDLEVMHFEYTPAGALVTEDSTTISAPMVLAIRVAADGRTYLHDSAAVTMLSNYP
ncbi:MAG: hypothetical protein R3A79_17295 [Nannocystaceae bacterium]